MIFGLPVLPVSPSPLLQVYPSPRHQPYTSTPSLQRQLASPLLSLPVMPWRYSGFSREAPRHHHSGSIRKQWVRRDELSVNPTGDGDVTSPFPGCSASYWRRGRHQPENSGCFASYWRRGRHQPETSGCCASCGKD